MLCSDVFQSWRIGHHFHPWPHVACFLFPATTLLCHHRQHFMVQSEDSVSKLYHEALYQYIVIYSKKSILNLQLFT